MKKQENNKKQSVKNTVLKVHNSEIDAKSLFERMNKKEKKNG